MAQNVGGGGCAQRGADARRMLEFVGEDAVSGLRGNRRQRWIAGCD